ncbi:MAG: helix-turn-helix domain-containing protein [Aeromicrobium sp.]
MGTRAVEKGPTSKRVAANVKALRAERRITLDELARRMAELGRPILKSGLSKLETGDRRVDVDDLMALAIALETNTNALLLDHEADNQPTRLTENHEAQRVAAWRWACGELSGLDEPTAGPWPFARFTAPKAPAFRFQSETRPHDPPRWLSAEEWGELRQWQRELDSILFAMRDAGLERSMFHELLKSGTHYVDRETEEGADDGER